MEIAIATGRHPVFRFFKNSKWKQVGEDKIQILRQDQEDAEEYLLSLKEDLKENGARIQYSVDSRLVVSLKGRRAEFNVFGKHIEVELD